MKFIVQDLDRDNPNSKDKLIYQAAMDLGHAAYLVSIKDIYTRNDLFDGPFAFHASCLMSQYIHQQKGVSLTDFRVFDCQKYYGYWSKYIRPDYKFLPLGSVLEFIEQGLLQYPFFIRPSDNFKSFAAFVCKEFRSPVGKDHSSDQDLEGLIKGMEPDKLVIVKPVRHIVAESRVIVRRGEVISSGLYGQDREHNEYPAGVKDGKYNPNFGNALAEEIAKHPYPELPNLYALDISLDEDNRLSLMELSGINSCGFYYSHDLKVIVEAMAEETEPYWN